MAKVTDDVLVRLLADTTQFKAQLASGAAASRRFVDTLASHSKLLAGLTVVQGVSFAAQAAFIRNVTNEAAAQETAINRLNVLLRVEQRTRTNAVDILTKQADSLQKITAFADEEIIAMQATAAAFKLNDQQIEKLTPHLLDVAAGFRDVEGNALDLETVTKAVGKALNGNSGALQKMGIDLGVAKGETASFEQVVAALEKRFGGAAVAAGQTFAGQMKIAQSQISEVKEAIGNALIPTIIDITRTLTPIIAKFAEWVSEHRELVLSIVGGGLAGSGVLAAISAVGLAIAGLGLAGGPISIAILGISTLVGLFVALKLETSQIPNTLEDINAELAEQTEKANELNKEYNEFSTGKKALKVGDEMLVLQKKIDDTIKRMKALQDARDKLNAPVKAGPVATTAPGDVLKGAGKGVDKEFEKDAEELRRKVPQIIQDMREQIQLGQQDFANDVVPQDQLDLIDARMQDLRDNDQEAWEAITASHGEFAATMAEQREALVEENANAVTSIAFAWGDMFAHVLESESNFARAFGKATVMGIVKVLGAEARKAIATILIEKAKELGKAAIGAPLSFGATLAATGPIIAAAAAAIGAIGALESKFAKTLGGFEAGGIIPRTGPYFMHAPEVVFNPRRNSARDLASNLIRAGAGKTLAELAAGGGRGDTNIDARLIVQGDVNGNTSLERAVRKLSDSITRALGASAG